MTQTEDPLRLDYFGPEGHHLNNLGKGPLANATYKISTFEPRSFGEEHFKFILFLNPRPPATEPFWTRGTI